MKNLVSFLLIVFAGVSLAQSARDECILAKTQHFNRLQKFADINYPGDSKYDVKYYKLDLTVNHVAHTISGNVTCNAVIT